MSKLKCTCGMLFENSKELRVHIALRAERWPIERCTRTHHDPKNGEDLKFLRWIAAGRTLR